MRNGTQDSQDTRDTTGSSGTTSPSESLALLTQTYVEDLAVRAYKPKTIAG